MVLRHRNSETLTVGARGTIHWDDGWLYYVGRAQWGWTSRAKRLNDTSRNKHWHIDYLQTSEEAELRMIVPFDVNPDRECELARRLLDWTTLSPLEEGLGASDCEGDCPGHVLTGDPGPETVLGSPGESSPSPSGAVVFRGDRCEWISSPTNWR